jgi:hypothetical protein
MFPLESLLLFGVGFVIGVIGLGYMFVEYRRIARRDAVEAEAAARSAAYSAG